MSFDILNHKTGKELQQFLSDMTAPDGAQSFDFNPYS